MTSLKIKIPVELVGGIGDILRNLSLLPLNAIKFLPIHIDLRVNSDKEKYGGEIHEKVLNEISLVTDALSGVSVSRENGGVFGRFNARILRFLGFSKLKRLKLKKANHSIFGGEATRSKYNVLLQPHITGVEYKRWSVESWSEVLRSLDRDEIHWWIVEQDAASAQILANCVRSSTVLSGARVIDIIYLAERMDFVVSVDSWMKYVARWNKIPQLILFPDPKMFVGDLATEKVISIFLPDLWRKPGVTILGIEADADRLFFTKKSMLDFVPQELCSTLEAVMKKPQSSRDIKSNRQPF